MIKKLGLIIMSVLVCLGLLSCYPFSTPISTPTPIVIPTSEATFTPGEDFDCWTAPRSEQPEQPVEKQESSFLMATGFPPVKLVRYFPGTDQMKTLATGINDYRWGGHSTVSPDGRYVWYAADEDGKSPNTVKGRTNLYIYDLENGQAHKLPWLRRIYETVGVLWSHDSQCLFFTGETSWIIAYRLSDGAMQEKRFPGYFMYSIDISPQGNLWAMKCFAGFCVHDLASPEKERLQIPFTGPTFGAPRWSPDGKILAYGDSDKNETALRGHMTQIHLVTFDGHLISNQVPLRSRNTFPYILWSPDGQRLLIGSGGNNLEFYDRNLKAYVSSPLSLDEGMYKNLAVWSPDGKQVAFLTNEFIGVIIYDLDNKTLTHLPLPEVERINSIEWLP